jgi:putative ABC transport system permease protein
MQSLWQDLRYGMRGIRANPGLMLASELWGVSARDPLTFAAVALVVLAAGGAACWFPAGRATRVDPMIALRFE